MTTTFAKYLHLSQNIEGWFNKPSAAIWDTLLGFQEKSGIKGNLGEIGVWEGKSALLAAMHQRVGETLLLIDPRQRATAQQTIEEACPETERIYFPKKSSLFRGTDLFQHNASSFRWFHIDGSHTAQFVKLDLEIADFLLDDEGIITLDDFFSPSYPQITEALFAFLTNSTCRLKLILVGFNKGYLCRPLAVRRYTHFFKEELSREMAERGFPQITIIKSTASYDSTCFGIGPSWENFDLAYRGPDWDRKNIEI